MGTAADDLRDREEQLWEDHVLGWCKAFDDCPYCDKASREALDTYYENRNVFRSLIENP